MRTSAPLVLAATSPLALLACSGTDADESNLNGAGTGVYEGEAPAKDIQIKTSITRLQKREADGNQITDASGRARRRRPTSPSEGG